MIACGMLGPHGETLRDRAVRAVLRVVGHRRPRCAGQRVTPLNASRGLAFFDTTLGLCGVAWSERGLTAVQLPESSATATRARLRSRFPEFVPTTPPRAVQQAIDGIRELLSSGRADLSAVSLDESALGEFERRVYALTRAIAPGQTSTYGALAAALGDPGAARAVGQAMGHNPFPLVVPCHRVLAADGGWGGFSAADGVATKLRLLRIEGAEAVRQMPLFES